MRGQVLPNIHSCSPVLHPFFVLHPCRVAMLSLGGRNKRGIAGPAIRISQPGPKSWAVGRGRLIHSSSTSSWLLPRAHPRGVDPVQLSETLPYQSWVPYETLDLGCPSASAPPRPALGLKSHHFLSIGRPSSCKEQLTVCIDGSRAAGRPVDSKCWPYGAGGCFLARVVMGQLEFLMHGDSS